MKILVVSIGLCLVASSSFGKSVCENYESAINEGIKAIAISTLEGEMNDKSAPQQTARNLSINHQLQLLQINTALSAQHNCSPRKEPIDPFQYRTAGVNCLKVLIIKEGNIEACDFKTWKPDKE